MRISQNTAISVKFRSKDESDVIICAFVSTEWRNGNWNVALPSKGFRVSEPFEYTGVWGGDAFSAGMKSYCKTMKYDPTPSPTPKRDCLEAGVQWTSKQTRQCCGFHTPTVYGNRFD
eukprot:409685_1